MSSLLIPATLTGAVIASRRKGSPISWFNTTSIKVVSLRLIWPSTALVSAFSSCYCARAIVLTAHVSKLYYTLISQTLWEMKFGVFARGTHSGPAKQSFSRTMLSQEAGGTNVLSSLDSNCVVVFLWSVARCLLNFCISRSLSCVTK